MERWDDELRTWGHKPGTFGLRKELQDFKKIHKELKITWNGDDPESKSNLTYRCCKECQQKSGEITMESLMTIPLAAFALVWEEKHIHNKEQPRFRAGFKIFEFYLHDKDCTKNCRHKSLEPWEDHQQPNRDISLSKPRFHEFRFDD